MKKFDAIIVGATGATGQELVKQLLNDPNFKNVTVFIRKKIKLKHNKLTVHEIDFSKLNNINSTKYLNMVELKTAVLIGASMKMGAIVAKASDNEQENIYEFGKNLGIAFQIQDDFLDSFGDEKKFGKVIGGDIIENKKTLLYVKSMEIFTEKDKTKLTKLYSSKHLDKSKKIEVVKELFLKYNIPSIIENEINYYTQLAFKKLDNLNISDHKKDFLFDFGNSLMKRKI